MLLFPTLPSSSLQGSRWCSSEEPSQPGPLVLPRFTLWNVYNHMLSKYPEISSEDPIQNGLASYWLIYDMYVLLYVTSSKLHIMVSIHCSCSLYPPLKWESFCPESRSWSRTACDFQLKVAMLPTQAILTRMDKASLFPYLSSTKDRI